MARMDDTLELPPSPKRFWQRKKRWLALFMLAGLVCMVALAPTLIATMPPMLQAIVESAVPPIKGQATIGGASLGWFSPVVIRDVVWRDAEGKPLAQVGAVRLERTLWQMLMDSADVGVIHVEQPHVIIVMRDGGSSLEDTLWPLLDKFQAPASANTTSVVIEGGSIELVDSAQDLAWQIEQVAMSVTLPANVEEASQLALTGQVHDSQGAVRGIDAKFAWHSPGPQPQAGKPGGTLTLKTTSTPLAMLRAIVRRMVPGADLNGVASCDVQWTYNADGSQQQLKIAQLAGKDLLFAAPQWFGTEALHATQLAASGDVQLAGGRLKLTGVKFDTDFAHGSADGQLPLAGWDRSASDTALATLQNEDYVIRGELDLARLAALLPETLRIREGTEITAGTVTVALISQMQGKRRRWDGELKSSQLTATQNGREIVWDEPITITLAAQQSSAGPVIERLSCASSFLALQARGTFDEGELTTSGDLAQLLTEANRFVDLDDVRLAGKLNGSLGWRRQAEAVQGPPRDHDDLNLQGQATVIDFEILAPGQQPWREPQLTIDVVAAGKTKGQSLELLEAATVRMVAGTDLLQFELTDAIAQPLRQTIWPLTCSIKGELARWLPRVQSWLPFTVEQASGAASLQANFIATAEAFQVRQFKLDIEDFRLQTMGLAIAEPEAHLDGDGLWTYAAQRFESQSLTLATSALACRSEKMTVEPRASGVAISGDIGYRADFERLSDWLTPASAPITRKLQGNTEGRLKFTHQGNRTQGKWTAEFHDFAYLQLRTPGTVVSSVSTPANQWEPIFDEPNLAWHGQGEFDHNLNRLTATHLNVTSDAVSITSRGQVDGLTTTPVVHVTGEIVYDLAKVGDRVNAYERLYRPGNRMLGDDGIRNFKLSGTDKRTFVLRGPLPSYATFASQDPRTPAVQKLVWPKELVGRAGIGWTAADIYGLPFGPANIDGALENGIISFAPIDVQVAEGRIKAWPRLVLSNEPMVFQLAKGTSAEQLGITPEMCQTWLRFVAPLLADATRAEGKFSATVDGATFPILLPEAGEARGVLTVHGARVGPGKLAEQYVSLARQIRLLLERKPLDPTFRPGSVEWLTMPQQEVQVEMKAGRIYHRGLQIQVQDTLLITSGSVGTDQTIDLIVEVPIREEWIAKDRVLSGLRGQSLKVPIGGTVDQPRIDGRALEQLAGQLFQNAAGSLLENSLQQGLDKLLRPKNP